MNGMALAAALAAIGTIGLSIFVLLFAAGRAERQQARLEEWR